MSLIKYSLTSLLLLLDCAAYGHTFFGWSKLLHKLLSSDIPLHVTLKPLLSFHWWCILSENEKVLCSNWAAVGLHFTFKLGPRLGSGYRSVLVPEFTEFPSLKAVFCYLIVQYQHWINKMLAGIYYKGFLVKDRVKSVNLLSVFKAFAPCVCVMENRNGKTNGKTVPYCNFTVSSYVHLITAHCKCSIGFQNKTLTLESPQKCHPHPNPEFFLWRWFVFSSSNEMMRVREI